MSTMPPIHTLTGTDLIGRVREGTVPAAEVVTALYDRMSATEPEVQAFLEPGRELALQRAQQVDEELSAGRDPGPLAGLPIAIKDNICLEGLPTTAASRILAPYRPTYTATAVQRLLQAGAIPCGKTNLDEFAMGSSCENSGVGPTRNPWDFSRVPGGSSGGSAAAVACGSAVVALGSDTGGSIRLPAALCGVVGMKPTYGRVSRSGLLAFASSLDQIGPMARTVEDAALVLGAMAGADPRDATSSARPVPAFRACLEAGPDRPRLGVPEEFLAARLEPEVRAVLDRALAEWEGLGAEIVPVSLPLTSVAIPAYYVIATAEASSNLARYDGVHYGYRAGAPSTMDQLYRRSRAEGFGPEVKRRILLGTFVLSSGYYDAYYARAMRVRTRIREELQAALTEVDAIVGPTAPFQAFPLGERLADPLFMYACDIFTVAVNLAGLPAISVPCGLTADRLPVGLQIIGPRFADLQVLQLAHRYEQATGWHRQHPMP